MPHVRYEQFSKVLAQYRKMLVTIDVMDCPCCLLSLLDDESWALAEDADWVDAGTLEDVCYWKSFHQAIRSLKHNGTYQGYDVAVLVEDPVRATRQGSKQRNENILVDIDSLMKAAQKRAEDVLDFLYDGLSTKVYDGEACEMITHIKNVLDMKSLIVAVHERGSVTIGNLSWDKFFKSSLAIDQSVENRIDKKQLKEQFIEYLGIMEKVGQDAANRELSSMELLEIFLSPEKQLYKGVETVMSILAKAALMMSVESVVEGWVSVMEHHSSQRRDLSDERAEDELFIAVNGPAVIHSDSVVRESLDKYCSQTDVHYVRSSNNIKSWIVSKSVDNLRRVKPKIPFMVGKGAAVI